MTSAPTVTYWAAVIAGAWLYQSAATISSDGASASLTIPAGASFSAAVSSTTSPYAALVTNVFTEMGQVKSGVIQIDSPMASANSSTGPAISQ